jgi:hypothetical protein
VVLFVTQLEKKNIGGDGEYVIFMKNKEGGGE